MLRLDCYILVLSFFVMSFSQHGRILVCVTDTGIVAPSLGGAHECCAHGEGVMENVRDARNLRDGYEYQQTAFDSSKLPSGVACVMERSHGGHDHFIFEWEMVSPELPKYSLEFPVMDFCYLSYGREGLSFAQGYWVLLPDVRPPPFEGTGELLFLGFSRPILC